MRWKQFFTPVKSLAGTEAREMLKEYGDDVQIVDVRQPAEYRSSHLPGAKLIPLPILGNSLDQLDRDKPVLVY